jgi:tetrapyrrole methylase family protein/MazG family protein
LGGVIEKVDEELAEMSAAQTQEEKVGEFGDVLMALVNIARWLQIDAEEALRLANRRFYRRFTYMEELCRERGIEFKSLSFEEQNSLWEQAKRQVG